MDASHPTTIVVASKNPVKAAAIQGAFTRLFPEQPFKVEGFSAASGVSDQPLSDQETKLGATNRVMKIRRTFPNADLWAGLEGGIAETDEGMCAFAWIVVAWANNQGAARTATFPLPDAIAKLIREGAELAWPMTLSSAKRIPSRKKAPSAFLPVV